MPDLPTGTVTFFFTDVEGSTRHVDELGADDDAAALAEHRRIVRDACGDMTESRSTPRVMPSSWHSRRRQLHSTPLVRRGRARLRAMRVRVGLHTGTPLVTEEGYVGVDVHRAARIAASGHGDQISSHAATPGRSSRQTRSGISASIASRISPRPSASSNSGTALPPLRSLFARTSRCPPPRSSAGGRARRSHEPSGGGCPAPVDRPRWHRKDSPRHARGGRGRRVVPRRNLVDSLGRCPRRIISRPRSRRRCRSRSYRVDLAQTVAHSSGAERTYSARQRRAPAAASRGRDRSTP